MEQLNSLQRQAVETNAHYVAIIAGPGTGKTKTLTARIAHLHKNGVKASEILALTFTNKAAREIRSRVTNTVGEAVKSMRITTFHGLCYELLGIGKSSDVRLVTESERLAVLRDLPHKSISLRELALRISTAKSTLRPTVTEPTLQKALDSYNTYLREHKLVDFDDLLLQTYDLLQSKESPKQFLHILVDEFQDTSELQYELLELLAAHANLFVIGDPLQAIYGFRGGRADIFKRFKTNFPNAETITLITNYRSVPQVVSLANAIFPDAPQLQAHHTKPGSAKTVEVLNEYSEAEWIINEIESALGGTDFLRSHAAGDAKTTRSFKDFAVLYRTHSAAKTLERAFADCGIPYQVSGEGSPYEQPFIQKILEALRELTESPKTKLSELVARIANELGLDFDNPRLKRDFHQFMSTLVRFDDKNPQDYLHYVDAIAEQNFYDDQLNAVALLTVHASKGLEFDHVFLAAAEEGILPLIRPKTQTDFDEEKRLFYVAITRAKTALDILHTKNRGRTAAKTSRFITAIPESSLPQITDPNMEAQRRRIQKREQKRNQTSLF